MFDKSGLEGAVQGLNELLRDGRRGSVFASFELIENIILESVIGL